MRFNEIKIGMRVHTGRAIGTVERVGADMVRNSTNANVTSTMTKGAYVRVPSTSKYRPQPILVFVPSRDLSPAE